VPANRALGTSGGGGGKRGLSVDRGARARDVRRCNGRRLICPLDFVIKPSLPAPPWPASKKPLASRRKRRPGSQVIFVRSIGRSKYQPIRARKAPCFAGTTQLTVINCTSLNVTLINLQKGVRERVPAVHQPPSGAFPQGASPAGLATHLAGGDAHRRPCSGALRAARPCRSARPRCGRRRLFLLHLLTGKARPGDTHLAP
jgi:hypothetical protein